MKFINLVYSREKEVHNNRPPTAIFFNNAGIQYKFSWKNRTIKD